jgi:hypothetical protein
MGCCGKNKERRALQNVQKMAQRFEEVVNEEVVITQEDLEEYDFIPKFVFDETKYKKYTNEKGITIYSRINNKKL